MFKRNTKFWVDELYILVKMGFINRFYILFKCNLFIVNISFILRNIKIIISTLYGHKYVH